MVSKYITGDTHSIEARVYALEVQVEAIRDSQEKELKTIEDLNTKFDSVILEFSKYKGFIGGVVFIATCILAFVKSIPFVGFLLGKK